MKNEMVIKKTKNYVKEMLYHDSSGHDWWHVYRVWKNAVIIASNENADQFIVELAALLHDIADFKLHNGNVDIGPETAEKWLETLGVEAGIKGSVVQIIKEMSFKGLNVDASMSTKEGMVVQDADRLDAIGAIGIGRAFAYGGYFKNAMYEPDQGPNIHNTFNEYKESTGSTINHFYEKLLHLKKLMNTDTGRIEARERHEFLKLFLKHFLREWHGIDSKLISKSQKHEHLLIQLDTNLT